MAFAATTVLECWQNGSDTNGGGFDSAAAGTDWSRQATPQYSVTDGVTAGTTTITSATAAFGTDVVGNVMYVQGGTGSVTAGWYQITARGSATSITVDRSTGLTAGTGVTLHIGGALASPAIAALLMAVAGTRTWVKYSATPYTLTSASSGVAGGAIVMAANVAAVMEGYETTRGDRTANRPVIAWGVALGDPGALTYIASTSNAAARSAINNIIVDGNSVAHVGGVNAPGSKSTVSSCIARNCNGTGGIGFSGNINLIPSHYNKADTCTTGFSVGAWEYCWATSCGTGFLNSAIHIRCLATSCTVGFWANTGNSWTYRCTADACTSYGFQNSAGGTYVKCLATNNTTYGFRNDAGSNFVTLADCATYLNGTAFNGTMLYNANPIALSGDPYVNKAGGDYRPNATAGAGLSLWNPTTGVFGQTDNEDIGAVQHTDPAGSGGATSFAY